MAIVEAVKVLFTGDAAPLIASMGAATKSLSRFGTNAFFLGSRITAGIGLPVAILTKAVVGVGAAFDQAMTESLAIMDSKGQLMRGQMESVAKDIALTTKFSAEEAAQAYFFLASSGMNAAESMKALPVAARFAQAGVIDLEKATELLSDAYITLGLRSSDPVQNMINMGRVADVLTEANNQAQGSILEFSTALTNRAGVAMRTFGIDVETGVAALAAFAERGIKGRTAGRQLFIVIRDLQRAVLKNNDAWVKLIGPNAVFTAAKGEFKNIADIIGVLEDSLEGLSDKQKKQSLQMLGFQERSLQATLALVGASDRIRELEAALYSAGGVTQRVSEKQMASFSNQISLITERVRQLAIELFDAFKPTIENFVLPAIRLLIEQLQSLNTWFANLSTSTKETITVFMGLAVALGPAIAVVGALALALIPIIGIGMGVAKVFGVLFASSTLLFRGVAALELPWIAFRIAMSSLTSVSVAATLLSWKTAILGLGPAAVAATKSIGAMVIASKGLGAAFVARVMATVTSLSALQLAFRSLGVAIASMGPVALAIGLAVLAGKLAWDGYQKMMGKVKEKQSDLSDQLGITAHRFTQLVNEFKTLTNKMGPLTKSEIDKLAHATEMLGQASGMSADRIREEIVAGTDITKVLSGMAEARWAELDAVLDTHKEKKRVLEEEIALHRRRNEEITKSIERGTTSIFALGGGEETESTTRNIFPVNKKKLAQLRKEQQNLLDLIQESSVVVKEYDAEIHSLTGQLGLWSSSTREATLEQAIKADADKQAAREVELAELQNEKYIQSVITLADTLLGIGGPSVTKLGEAWALLSIAEIQNEKVIKRLWDEYKKLRAELDPSEYPADIENATRAHRLLDEAIAFSTTTTGRFIDSMRGVDTSMDHLVSNQGAIVEAYDELNGVMDPRFFETHGKQLKILAEHYADDLTPEMQEIIKQFELWGVTSTDTVEKVVGNHEKAADELIESSDRMTASMMDKQAELAVFSLSTQDAELVGLKKGYNTMKLSHALKLDEMLENLTEMSEKERHMGILRVEEFKENSKEMLAAEKRIGLLRMLQALDVDNDIIRNHKKFTDEWLEAEIERASNALDVWEDYRRRILEIMSGIGGLLTELATAIPGLNSTAKAISGIASASAAFGESKKSWDAAKNGFDKVTAAVGMATAAVAAFNAMSQIKSKKGRVAAGALAGAQMGSTFGPWGALIGAGIGALAGLIMKDPGWQKIQKNIEAQWGVSVSDALAKAIEETAEEVGDHWGAAILHIGDVITEAGGVTEENVGHWTRQVRDAFSMIDQGVFTTAEAAKVLDENFGALAEAGIRLSGIIREDVFELMLLDEQFETNSAAIKEFKNAMVDQAIVGLMMFAEGVTFTREKFEAEFDAKIAKLKELREVTEEEVAAMREAFEAGLFHRLRGDFRDLGEYVEIAFAVMVEQGKPLVQILLELGPALDELILLVDMLGFEGSETLEMLLRFREFTKVNEGLMLKIDGARMMMIGLTNSGYLSEKAFKKFGRTIVRQFDELIKRGLSSDEALLLMLPSLIALRDAAALYGFEIDENTQALIDQAEEKGLMGSKAKTVDEKMLEGIEIMVEALKVIIELFGGEIPDSMKTMAEKAEDEAKAMEDLFVGTSGKIQDSFDKLHIPNLDTTATVTIKYDDPGRPGQPKGFQHGGIISKPTLAMTGEGGEPEMIGPVGFMSKALEGAMAKRGTTQLEREMLEELQGLRSDLKTLPLHLRDAIILTG